MEHFATAQQVFVVGLVFARVAAMAMVMPGLGDQPAPTQVRLAFSILMALIIAPVVANTLPPTPPTISELMGAVLREVILGLMIGSILRTFMGALATAGEVISIQTTLSFAQTANPTMAGSSSSLATFLGLMGVVLIMTTDLHHLFLAAMVKSYTLFPYGRVLPVADATHMAIRTLSGSFSLGIQLSAPILVFSLVFNLATGLVGRAMPQFQIFFAAAPLQVLLGLSLFALSLGVIGMVWVDRYRDVLKYFG